MGKTPSKEQAPLYSSKSSHHVFHPLLTSAESEAIGARDHVNFLIKEQPQA
jgi:hypothetical protein